MFCFNQLRAKACNMDVIKFFSAKGNFSKGGLGYAYFHQ